MQAHLSAAGIPAEVAAAFGAVCDDGGFDLTTLHTMSLDELAAEVCDGKRGHARKLHLYLSELRATAAGTSTPAVATVAVPTATAVMATAMECTAMPAAEAARLPVTCPVAVLAGGATTTAGVTQIPFTHPLGELVCGAAARPAAAFEITSAGEGVCAVEESATAAAEATGALPTLGSATERYGTEFGPRCGRRWHEGIPIMRSWIEVLWSDGKWYRGRVTACDPVSGLHRVTYDDGDKKEYDLTTKDFRVFMWEDGTMGD